jgi:23S rRNA pseudouridine2457 synthase
LSGDGDWQRTGDDIFFIYRHIVCRSATTLTDYHFMEQVTDKANNVIVLFNKPFRVLSQFTTDDDKTTLADFIDIPNVYCAGRLDYDSEGLLVLTDDGKLQQRLANPKFSKKKRYWVQVEGVPTKTDLDRLRRGIQMKDGMTKPATAALIRPPALWKREPPIRERRNIPTSWIDLAITEGRNRQVRRMTAHIGYPTLRLVRYAVSDWQLDGLAPGEYRVIGGGTAVSV